MKKINGGVCAAKGFTANGIHCGIRKNKDKKDLALIYSEKLSTCVSVYTKNVVCGAPVAVTKKHLRNGLARAIICNSGNANTCNENGIEIAGKMCELTADYLKIEPSDVVIASTGVIGQPLELEPIKNGMPALVSGLSDKGSNAAASAIMTTDTVMKEIAFEFKIGDSVCKIGGIAKGSGMIHPNMATMLVFITTDCNISPVMLRKALKNDVVSTFNMISVDGDTSTNDMVTLMANGLAKNICINDDGEEFDKFTQALNAVTLYLCREIAADGEGATKLITCNVTGARTKKTANLAAKSVVSSSLVKAMIFGRDANVGRILCALGYSGAINSTESIDIELSSSAGSIAVAKNGFAVRFDEETAKKVLMDTEIIINIELHSGEYFSTAWGCDLTYDYVKINGDYRS